MFYTCVKSGGMSAKGASQLSPSPDRRRKASREKSPEKASREVPEPSVTTDLGPIDSVLGFHMLRASFVFAPDAKSTRGFPRWEMTILSVVSANPEINQISLAKALRIDQGNLILQLNALIKRGLLTKVVPAGDRRVRCLKLTAAGEARLAHVLPIVRKLETQRLVDFSEEERKTLVALLKRVHTPTGPLNPLVERALRRGINAK
jgi:DNA-binding MarR family transcriptional regulator